MEAVAKHDFQATADDELSFYRGAKLKVRQNFKKHRILENWYTTKVHRVVQFVTINPSLSFVKPGFQPYACNASNTRSYACKAMQGK